MTPLMTSARTCWAAKPTTATRREELVSKVVLRALVVVKRLLSQMQAMMVKSTFDMLRRNLI